MRDWTRPVSGDGITTLFIDLVITPKPALDIRRMAGGLVRVELSEVRALCDVLSQAAAEMAGESTSDNDN